MKNDFKPMISIIVPVFKVEEYIEECVDSILEQSYGNFELILVDDGSPDNCGKICDDYIEKDNRVKVIHKTNGGLSDARNKGIDSAIGDYITFIDSDDYIHKDYLKLLFDTINRYNADIVQVGHTSIENNLSKNGNDRRKKPFLEKIFNRKEALSDYLLYKTIYANSWGKLYKTSLFKNVRFPLNRLTEDEYTTYRVIINANKIVCLSNSLYFYRKREGSIVRTYNERRFDVCNELAGQLKTNLEEANIYNESEVNYKIMRVQLKIYNDFVQGGSYSEYKLQLDEIQNRIKKYHINFSEWEKKYILIILMLRIAPPIYRFIVGRHRKSYTN